MKIIADNTIPFLKGRLEAFADIQYLPSDRFTAAGIRDADVLIVRSIDKCTREVLEGSRVRLITTATIGYDHIDTAYCDAAGIVWRNAPGSNARSVAEYLLASCVVLSLKTGEALEDKTIGIVGVGQVGRQVEAVCSALGMRVLRNDPPRAEAEGNEGFVDLQTIAEEADIITVHTPLTRDGRWPTYHLLDQQFYDLLRRKPWFVNAGRGALADTAALISAKEAGKVSRLVLDCWEGEPRINSDLARLAAIATPHIAGFSADGKANATRMCLEAIAEFCGLDMRAIGGAELPPPRNPVLDVSTYKNKRVFRAILDVYNPLKVDKLLRNNLNDFENLRTNYCYPREFSAYSVRGANEKEADIFRLLGFSLDTPR